MSRFRHFWKKLMCLSFCVFLLLALDARAAIIIRVPEDYITIQDALASADEEGTIIMVAEGEYDISGGIIIESVNLIGAGPDKTRLTGVSAGGGDDPCLIRVVGGSLQGFLIGGGFFIPGVCVNYGGSIKNNVIHGSIKMDEPSDELPTLIANNTVNGRGGNCLSIFMPGPEGRVVDIRNNIISNCNCAVEIDEYEEDFEIFYNDLWNNSISHCGSGNLIERNGLNADPEFLDDFILKLASDSPCINAGDPAILDADGSRSDMGAYGGPQYYIPSEEGLSIETHAPEDAFMGRNYEIKIEVSNTSDSPRTFDFSLNETRQDVPDVFCDYFNVCWNINESGIIVVYKDGNYEDEFSSGEEILIPDVNINPGQTIELLFVINHKWHWIKPWGADRIMEILLQIGVSAFQLPYYSAPLTAGVFMNQLMGNLKNITYSYDIEVDGISESFDIDVEVPKEKIEFLGESGVAGVIASLFTTAGFATGGISPWAITFFVGEAVSYGVSESKYISASDPLTDYTEIVLPEVLYIDDINEIEDRDIREICENFLELLAYGEAMSLSYLKYEAAEDDNSINWMFIHQNLCRRYANAFALKLSELRLAIQETVDQTDQPTQERIQEIKDELFIYGLPPIEASILEAKGYSEADIENIAIALSLLDEEYFTAFDSLPAIMENYENWMASVLGDLPVIPGESIAAVVDLKPETLNVKSKGNWITCYIELPEGNSINDVVVSAIFLNEAIVSEPKFAEIGDYDYDGIPDLMVKFDGGDLISLMGGERGEPVFTVSGILNNGISFIGEDVVRIH